MQKPESIILLEKKLGLEFEEIWLSKIMLYKFEKKAYYALNEKGLIRGLRITRINRSSIIQDLSDFSLIEKLNLHGNYIISLSGLQNFRQLTGLNLCENQLSNFQIMRPLRKVEFCNLNPTRVLLTYC